MSKAFRALQARPLQKLRLVAAALACAAAAACASAQAAEPDIATPTVAGTVTAQPLVLQGQPGSIPGGTVSPTLIYHAAGSGKYVSLTFDDGPSKEYTPQVLAVLDQYHIKAVFCEISENLPGNEATVRQLVADGQRLCDHTVTHDEGLDKRPAATMNHQIVDAQTAIEDASGGARVAYFRAPGGAFSPTVRQVAAQHGMESLAWSVDPSDWKTPGTDSIIATVKKQVRPGSIVLFHDGGGNRTQTVAAIKVLIPWLISQGYQFAFPADPPKISTISQ